MLRKFSGLRPARVPVAPAVVFAGLLLALLGGCRKQQEAAMPPMPVQVGQAEVQTVPVSHEYVGQTSAKDTVDLRARVSGFLEKVDFQEGAHVRAGQVLFQIEAASYQAALASAQAALARDEASLIKANQDVARLKPLAAAKAAPQQDLDAAVAQQAAYEASLKADKAQIETAKLDLGYTTVRSPIDGVIGKLAVTRGNLVGKGDNTLLATVSSYTPMYVYFSIPEEAVSSFLRKHQGKGSAGQLTMMLSDGTEFANKGTLNFADRAVDQTTGTLSVRGAFPNPEGSLRPGQFVRVKISGETVENAVLVPQKAVTDMLAKKMVLTVDDKNVVGMKEVTIGGEYQDKFIITSGLKGGERIIVEGLQKARPGAPVTPVPAASGMGK
ncbi:MAG: efflux RND transporter periplasmic adaptor subunit [Acidobacteriota bacterium]|nr:efflux RND transporter periplasmic adaptor subunit [Acidobacteriota bacterium]